VALSPLGEQQSREMGERYKDDHFDAVFTSDLSRA
jgi:broad specificity phosphatase PhoE